MGEGGVGDATAPGNGNGDFEVSGLLLGLLEDCGDKNSIKVGRGDCEGAGGADDAGDVGVVGVVDDAAFALGDGAAGAAVGEGGVADAPGVGVAGDVGGGGCCG